MAFDRLLRRVQPVRRADVESDIARGLNIFHAKGEDDGVAAGCTFDFAHDLPRFIRVTAQD